jgi:hypothetical protein
MVDPFPVSLTNFEEGRILLKLLMALLVLLALACGERPSIDERSGNDAQSVAPTPLRSNSAQPHHGDSIGHLCPPPDDAVATGSGAITKILREGTGAVTPPENAGILVIFTTSEYDCDGYLLGRGDPLIRGLDALPSVWRDVIKSMVIGEVRRAWFTSEGTYRITDFELRQFGTLEP